MSPSSLVNADSLDLSENLVDQLLPFPEKYELFLTNKYFFHSKLRLFFCASTFHSRMQLCVCRLKGNKVDFV